MIRMKRFLMLSSVTVLVAGLSGQAEASLGLNNGPSSPGSRLRFLAAGWTPDAEQC